MDVIVNSTATNLKLSQGAVSARLLAAGGASIQAECTANYPKGITFDQIAETSGGQLLCQIIYHCACPEWDKGTGHSEKVSAGADCFCVIVSLVVSLKHKKYIQFTDGI